MVDTFNYIGQTRLYIGYISVKSISFLTFSILYYFLKLFGGISFFAVVLRHALHLHFGHFCEKSRLFMAYLRHISISIEALKRININWLN